MSEQLQPGESPVDVINVDTEFAEIVKQIDPEYTGENSASEELALPYGQFTMGVESVLPAVKRAAMTSTGYTGNNAEESR